MKKGFFAPSSFKLHCSLAWHDRVLTTSYCFLPTVIFKLPKSILTDYNMISYWDLVFTDPLPVFPPETKQTFVFLFALRLKNDQLTERLMLASLWGTWSKQVMAENKLKEVGSLCRNHRNFASVLLKICRSSVRREKTKNWNPIQSILRSLIRHHSISYLYFWICLRKG